MSVVDPGASTLLPGSSGEPQDAILQKSDEFPSFVDVKMLRAHASVPTSRTRSWRWPRFIRWPDFARIRALRPRVLRGPTDDPGDPSPLRLHWQGRSPDGTSGH